MKKLVHRYLPPVAREFGNRLLGTTITYKGPHRDWASATARSANYAAQLARVEQATDATLRGVGWDQDGAVFAGHAPPSYILSALLLAAKRDHRLCVLDFGGGLGGLYHRWRPWLLALGLRSTWCVVEQPMVAAAGRQRFAGDSTLLFADSIAEAPQPNVVLASGVLHLLEQPIAALRELAALDASTMILDRTPMLDAGAPAVVTMHTPRRHGGEAHPRWLIPRAEYAAALGGYTPLQEFTSPDADIEVGGLHAVHRGGVWLRQQA